MTATVYIAASLDGYIADAEGGLDWLTALPNPAGEDYGWADFIARIDAIVMGRITFETVLSFGEWPYDKPVFVLSRTLDGLPAAGEGKAELIHGDVAAIVARLRARGFANLYVDGGGTIQSFLQADLIDELIITRVPILLGGGFPLFGALAQPLHFTCVDVRRYDNGLVKSRYVRAR